MQKHVLGMALLIAAMNVASAQAQSIGPLGNVPLASAASGIGPQGMGPQGVDPLAIDPYVRAHDNRGGAGGGFVGPNGVRVMSVQRLRQSRDDTYAVLRGHIVTYLGDEKYVFADESGQIRIDLSWEDMPYGTTFDQSRKVEISGELDREFGALEFDVNHMRLL